MSASSRLPVAVIGGYLGAGKTTLLNRLLAEDHGMKLAVLVNDFGSVNIDAALIASRDGRTISLTNGCVCCTIGDNLGLALHDLAGRADGPDGIVIEASGVADPGRIADYATSHPRLALDSIVVVADAETIRQRAGDSYVGDLVRLQLAAADVIVLSKTDLLDGETCRQAAGWIEAEVPGARLLTAPDIGLFTRLLLMEAVAAARPAPSGRDHGQMFATWTFSRAQPLDGAALRETIAALPPAVVRAKGIVRLTDAPSHRFVLQLVGRRWSLEPDDVDDSLQGRSTVVCIGRADELDAAHLETLFARVGPTIDPAVAALLQREERP
jgi:G3E family GTPase